MSPSAANSRVAATARLTELKGVGPAVAAKLAAAGLTTVRDLLLFFPRRHAEVVELAAPTDDALDRLVRIAGEVASVSLRYLPGRRSLVAVRLVTPDRTPFEVGFFNQPYLKKAFARGDRKVLQGVLARRGSRFVLVQPRVVGADAEPGPVALRYPELEGVGEARLRALIAQALARTELAELRLEPLPAGLADELRSGDVAAALRAMHAPASLAEHERERRGFALREAVALFRRVERARRARARRKGPVIATTSAVVARIEARIPFRLTADQDAAVTQLDRLLRGPAPMGVLLQGDVGTGKTAVAVHAALRAIAAGWQVAFLAPTELLAEQHFAVVTAMLEGSQVRAALLTASAAGKERRQLEQDCARGHAQLVFGTHALLSATTRFARLGLVVIDEQQRFGVAQRMQLIGKGKDPHVLVMTATPIPRTLALAMFGDLELITLRERPPGKRPVPALHLDRGAGTRLLAALERCVRRGGQAYVVCSQVGEDGEKDGALAVHAGLARRFRAGLVHGRMRAAERQPVTDGFRAGEIEVLVGTTVLEVGVDVPNARLMVVLDAERFGLATLHQLRGRVGRGGKRGLCLVVGERSPRVDALCKTTDGFALAELDLQLRGAGELLGTMQSGLGDLRALDPFVDGELLMRAREAVRGEPAPAPAR